MVTILLKRGFATDLERITLKEGEPAITFNEDKSTAQLYVGGADGKKILVTADVAGAVTTVLEKANRYADSQITAKIAELIGGAPATLDTLMELATALQENQSAVQAINSAITGKVDKADGKGLSEANFTNAEKTKLAGVAANANNYTHPSSHAASIITQDSTHRFVSDTEKSKWNAKLDSSSIIDCGTF